MELITASALYITGGLITGYAPNLAVLIIGRLIYGIGIGLVSSTDKIFYLCVFIFFSTQLNQM